MVFGYVTVDKGEMLIKDFDTYKAVYCSLCKQLGKDYSFLSRFILSYDCTFYALLDISLSDECSGFCDGRCKFNPLKKCNYLKANEDSLSKAAALSVITAYYKLVDNIRDGNIFTKAGCYLVLPFFSRWRKKARARYGYIDDAVSVMSNEQFDAEKDARCLVDKASQPTATMLATVLSHLGKNDDDKKVCYNFGYFLGKWIYLCDAINDYDDDLKHKSFNPYIIAYDKDAKDHTDDINSTLNYCLSQAFLSYNFIKPKRFERIIENIITKGLPKKQKSILYKETEK